MSDLTNRRKAEHIEIALSDEVDLSFKFNWFDSVRLMHNALPDHSFDDIDLSWRFLGYELEAPLLIEGMTGGHESSLPINEALAGAAHAERIAIGVGSQRAALKDRSLIGTYRVVREVAHDVPVIANLGVSHILGEEGTDNAKRAIDMIDADAIAIHLNPLQELIQPEGDKNFSDSLISIRDLVRELDVPVIIKEVGSGLSYGLSLTLRRTGVEYLDVAGQGGTSWSLIEGKRAPEGSLERKASIRFADWGIPTPVSIIEASRADLKVIGSGGVRSGIDAAKCIALGARAAGAARPFFLAAARGGVESVVTTIRSFKFELKLATFLTGSLTPDQLRLRKSYSLLEPLLSLTRSRVRFLYS
ncbi:MAG: type 2 isopentenyl-diphosphate Delta-isomerase [Candidatus Korarchaeum sp.]|nr:type 2 isopentenyl-diphosphate Delta-isomerase [Candidatus Korarchaeum sp.]MDW8035711.1 type 2 isopentenyl-diphosphate Delta-isomerase [Candidatus Korarchaeum sp.]